MKYIMAVCILLTMTGCGLGKIGVPPQKLDLGVTIPEDMCTVKLQPITILPVTIAPQYQTNHFIWRKGDGPPNAYAQHEWIAPVNILAEQLLRQCFTKAGTQVVRPGNSEYQIQVHIDQFEHHYYDTTTESAGLIHITVTFLQNGNVKATTTTVTQMPSEDNPIAGAASLRLAYLSLINGISHWSIRNFSK